MAVALSGGGDSLALLLVGAEWASRAGRGLLVLTVDHRLRPESADWTQACAAIAHRLNLPFRALAWEGEKPSTGLPAAARLARHRLLADAARQAGARVVLVGHTADDGLEARMMRAEGSTTPEPREWSPSPAWPEGRGVFLLRPMLDVRRADIRDWLRMRREPWIDDPANEDTHYARPRARRALALGARPPGAASRAPAADLAIACRADPGGGLEIAREALRAAPTDAVARFVSAACLCAAGTDRPPARSKIERLTGRLRSDEPFTASLAGARIEAGASQVRFLREAGEFARGGLAPLGLQAGETAVWDGRFEVTVQRAAEIRAAPRSTWPLVVGSDGQLVEAEIRPLAYERLLAACGVLEREPA
ncbi:tRNA lysidine(34) synthetase TilS [Phenylobacterium sp.]|uniref:tRNA lysidine(34) synthetase TilS n=1 Tax=Phenylobacterium sp. TaxID=1871053 RepID=UPI002622419B|nr:tRNA lysidine(34) synthetase TilS [Phenylobacterium sp.]